MSNGTDGLRGTPCRRCSECTGAEHHWMESVYGGEPIGENSPSHICKHCDARGDECEACDGAGGEVVDIGEHDNGGVALCPPCKGHGVIARDFGGCACPREDARDCIRRRMKDDMREHLGAPTLCDDDDECQCSCHDDNHYDEDAHDPT